MQEDLKEWNDLSKDQPNINHLDIGCGGETAGDTDKEGGEDEEGGQVHRNNRLEEEVLEEVGGVHDAEHLRGRCHGCTTWRTPLTRAVGK